MTSFELLNKQKELITQRDIAVEYVHRITGAIGLLHELIEKTKAEEAEADAFKESIKLKLEDYEGEHPPEPEQNL